MFTRVLIISLSFMVLFLSGCGTQKQIVVAKKKEVPSWYLNPPQSNSSDLYSVGYGRDKKSATTDALAQMVSTLSVSISSKFSAKTVSKNRATTSSSSSTYIDESTSEVKTIRIGNYQVLESANLGFKKYAVLVNSNKAKLFQSMLQEIEQDFEIIDKQKATVSKENAIKQMTFYKNSKESLATLPNRLLVMSELKSSFHGSKYLNKMNAINSAYENLLLSITFSIMSNNQASNLKASISKGLSAKKFKIAKHSTKKHFRIHINSKIERANAYGFTLARSAIEISVKDYTGTVIGSNKINIVGQSTQGFAIAKENIAIKLNELIQKDGIGKIIGLEI